MGNNMNNDVFVATAVMLVWATSACAFFWCWGYDAGRKRERFDQAEKRRRRA